MPRFDKLKLSLLGGKFRAQLPFYEVAASQGLEQSAQAEGIATKIRARRGLAGG